MSAAPQYSALKGALSSVAILAAMGLAVAGLTRLFSPDAASPAQNHAASAPANPALQMAAAWNGEINYAPAYSALNPYADASAHAVAAAFDPADDYWGLPRSEGYETVAAYCAACHSLQIVMAQHQPREGWDYLLTWMAEKQGMAPPTPEMRAEILDYLTREFGAGEP